MVRRTPDTGLETRVQESGQALVFMAIAGPILAVLILFLANMGILGSNRAKTWGGTDMTALSGATLYARGLNVLSATNALAVATAGLDAIVLAATDGLVDPKTRLVIQKGQDLFSLVWRVAMESGALWAARENGLRFSIMPPPSPLIFWNPEAGGLLVPSLNIRRRSLWELLLAAFGADFGANDEDNPEENADDEPEKKPSYTDSEGQTHEFDPSEVEPAGTYPSGKPRQRVKKSTPNSGGKSHGGKFVKAGKKGKQSGPGPDGPWTKLSRKFLMLIEADLVDKVEGVHTVLVYANRDSVFWMRPKKLQHAIAEAEAFGGSLEFWKEGPNFDGRLIKISSEAMAGAPLAGLGAALALAIRH